MKILVTGACGFIGSNLVPQLLNAGHEVIGIDNLTNNSIRPTDRMKAASGNNWEKFRFYKDDVRGPDILTTMMREQIECVVHLAAVGSVPRSFLNPTLTISANDVGFVNLLQAMSLLKIPRLVFASSSSVYGSSQAQVKTEGHEGFPLSPYALSKRMNEDFARIWAKGAGINFVGLRFFNVYGPGQLVNSDYAAVIPRWINHDVPTLYGDGTTVRDFTFVGDVVEAIIKAISVTENKCAIVNVGTGQGTSLRDLLEILGKNAKVMPERPGDIKYSVASTLKAEDVLSFKSHTNIVDGIRITREFYEKEYGQEGKSEFQEGPDASGG